MDSIERQARARRLARHFLATENITVERLARARDHATWECELRVAMPGNPDLSLRVRGTGYQREAAADVAHAELDGDVMRYFLDEQHGNDLAQAVRLRLAYEPGPLAFLRVRAAAAHAGLGEVASERVGRAAVHAQRARPRGHQLTIGDVLEQLIAETEPQAALL